MTTPVLVESKSENAEGQMAFVIPKDVAESAIPKPASSQVEVTKRPGGKFAVIRFAGRVDLEIRKQQQTKLSRFLGWVTPSLSQLILRIFFT